MRRKSRAGMLASRGWSFSPFTRDEYQEIHRATMEVLWETGVYVGHDEAFSLFGDAGARVDMKNNMVRIPEWLIQDILKTAPETFVMHARNPEKDFLVGGKRVGFTNFGESVLYRDPYTNEIREPSKKDLADVTRMTDYLEEVDFHDRDCRS